MTVTKGLANPWANKCACEWRNAWLWVKLYQRFTSYPSLHQRAKGLPCVVVLGKSSHGFSSTYIAHNDKQEGTGQGILHDAVEGGEYDADRDATNSRDQILNLYQVSIYIHSHLCICTMDYDLTLVNYRHHNADQTFTGRRPHINIDNIRHFIPYTLQYQWNTGEWDVTCIFNRGSISGK